MTIKLTINSLSGKIGMTPDELIKLLKDKGITCTEDEPLNAEQIKLIKESMKKRSTVSVNSKSSKDASKADKSGSTIIKRVYREDKSSKPIKLSLSSVKKPPVKTTKKPTTETKKVAEPKKASEPKDETPIPAAAQTQEPVTQAAPEKFNAPTTISAPKPKAENQSIQLGSETTLAEIAEKTGITEQKLSQEFFNQGYMIKKNDPIDFDTASLLLDSLDVSVSEAAIVESEATEEVIVSSGPSVSKPPVITIMGHVDHGKTSLLDFIRKTKVAAKESGGITQHIGAYQVSTTRGLITFLDTPGHEAFSAMRGRGAHITDIVVLIIAANDGIKPQTIESIQHAKSTNTPIIVAITKMDIAEAGRVDTLLSELSNHDVVAEDWGGDTAIIKLSSKTGEGVDDLLEAISLQAEIMELKAPESGTVTGTVLESKIDRGRGAVISLLIRTGTLKVGDIVSIGPGYGKIRTMTSSTNERMKSAGPATPIEVTGISPLPYANDSAISHTDEKSARQAAQLHLNKLAKGGKSHALTLDELLNKQDTSAHKLSIILKADTQGSLEAITSILEDIDIEDTTLTIIDAQVGSVNSSDASLAANTGAQIIAFHVNVESTAKKILEQHSVSSHQFKIIYPLIDHIKLALKTLKGPLMTEKHLGRAEIKAVFRSSKYGQISGCGVLEGQIKRGEHIRITRDDEVVFEGELSSLKREKETITVARKDTECGLGLKGFSEAKVGDKVECYSLEEQEHA